jgi:hypothetical protein
MLWSFYVTKYLKCFKKYISIVSSNRSKTFRLLDLTQHPIIVVKNRALWLEQKVYEYVDDTTLNTVKLVPA